jgi:PEP-CTERM motif
MTTKLGFLVTALASLAAIPAAYADSDYDKPEISFSCAIGACGTDLSGQLKLQVIGDKNNEDSNVYFKFLNNVGIQSSIVLVSFQGLSDLAFLHSIGGNPERAAFAGTEFQKAFHDGGATADELPTGTMISFNESWTAQAVTQGLGGVGLIANGVNAQDEAFELIDPVQGHPNYLQFLSMIKAGDIRVGIYVIGLPGGGDATYLSNVTAVPEPGTYGMLLLGLAGVALLARRRLGVRAA